MSQKYVYNPLTCEYDIINEGAPGVPGPRGPVGPPGSAGANGVGVPTGGTTGQVLAKASDDDFDTEWVTGGGGGGDLQSVLDTGNSAVDSVLNLSSSISSETVYLGFEDTGSGPSSVSALSFNDTSVPGGKNTSYQNGLIHIYGPNNYGSLSGTTQIGPMWMNMENSNGDKILLDGENATIELHQSMTATVIKPDPAGAPGNFYIPAATYGTETFATREWVADNTGGGGGGGILSIQAGTGISVDNTDPSNPIVSATGGGGGSVGTLSQVLLQGNQTDGSSIVVNDSGMPGEQIEINAYQLLASGPNGATTVSPNNINLNSMMGGSANISLDGSSMSSNQLSIVDNTYGVEIIATREWVNDNAGGGGGGTPDLDAVLDQGSVANNKTVWLGSDSSGMTTIQPGDIAFANDAMDESGSMSAYNLSFNSTPADEYSLLGANQLQFTSNANNNMSMLGAGSLVLAPDTNDSNTVLTSSEVLVGDGANEHVSIGTYPEAELRMSSNVASLTVDINGLAIGGTLHLPDPEGGNATVATREYVRQQGDTTSRPVAPEIAEMYFDTTLGHPIWYDGSQWVDATGTGV